MRILRILLLAWVFGWVPQVILGQQKKKEQSLYLDSLRHYQQLYNQRVELITQAELGPTLMAIGKMSAADTAVFDQDSIQRIIDQGNDIIQGDSLVRRYHAKMQEMLRRWKGLKKDD